MDNRGIEGLPLRLMVVALLISLTLPTVLSYLDQLDDGIDGRRLASVAEDISRTIEDMAADGPGNTRVVKLPADLPAGTSIVIGGKNGSVECQRLTWMADGQELGSRYLNNVMVLTEDGSPMKVRSGSRLRLACPEDTWGVVMVGSA